MAAAKTPTKKIKKDIKVLRRRLNTQQSRSAKVNRKVEKKTNKIGREMEKLQADIQKLASKKTPKKQLSEYNLFMRRQLRSGKSFGAAVKLWKSYKRGITVKTKVRRQIKYITRPKIITKTRTVIRKVPGRTIVKVARSPTISYEKIMPRVEERIIEIVNAQMPRQSEKNRILLAKEKIAVKLVALYFQEVHSFSVKRQITIDQVVDAYGYIVKKLRAEHRI